MNIAEYFQHSKKAQSGSLWTLGLYKAALKSSTDLPEQMLL